MDLELKGKTALISGSTAGIGRAIATTLAREGARAIVNGRSQTSVDAVVGELRSMTGGDMQGFAGTSARRSAAEELARRHPGVEILVNNLGIFEPKPFEDIPDADWLRFFEVNVLSGVRLARLYLPAMKRANWGRIIFISSESAVQIPAEMIHYGMTKTAQLAVSRGLAEAVAGTGITVNCVLPGPTKSRGVGEFVDALAKAGGKVVRRVRERVLRESAPDLADQAIRFARGGRLAGGLCRQPPGVGDDRRCSQGGRGRHQERALNDREKNGKAERNRRIELTENAVHVPAHPRNMVRKRESHAPSNEPIRFPSCTHGELSPADASGGPPSGADLGSGQPGARFCRELPPSGARRRQERSCGR